MLTPLIQRQTMQTLAVEAVRLSGEGLAQVQQEQARRQVLEAEQAAAKVNVADVEASDVLRLTEREGRGKKPGHGLEPGEDGPEAGSPAHGNPAGAAGSHLDLLA